MRALIVATLALFAGAASAQEAPTFQSLLDRGYEVKAAINQGAGYEMVMQKEASVFVCAIFGNVLAAPVGAPKSKCVRFSQK